ncbi:UDP-glucose 4-epimerase GalE [Candidatus Shapirobacteria bacterium CG11_big_fil_rev_8_21_14_0_20_40_12]|uniref:UDP-glucose 4-epimerase n=3 Tax=Candidatus Shapironibacteriota TaxID=1752721 RepID=A0A2M8EUD0_9BACT|nr:MAG: UDP-glucose 4-epimerase GalE [Candidatus Shapirobacteria bacterium CG11_big_fil_rev_8_21_14_0_20_40_12]PJC28730.1 MAG: UDP-glucose 4-epimerase GalE [Candidatus Shapirobacteria bacterium CG_4_9_14_0_2_um_filter_40_11]PJC76001.1 MAG: UDP-glucose 4-epimerase GalE [Candidatus Shapirobacteria bacterium CG_4_8_14_3_um_filter_39_11]
MKILVTGGAGYIGSHTVVELLKQGHEITVFDNLVCGHKEPVICPLIIGDLLDKNQINAVFEKDSFDGVIHFAAYALAGESMNEPRKYFENNILGGLNLLEAMKKHGVDKIIFSSSCSQYGFPEKLPVTEEESKKPASVYGESKLMFETILQWYDSLFGIKNVCLRYFNAGGASLDGSMGEDHDPETHIIPIAIQTALGQREKFVIFGMDYKTPDGTNIRDYVHVLDLADAHIRALEYLVRENESNYFNVGTGKGYSNKEIVEMVKKISGINFMVEFGPRRLGDPDAVYADNTKIKKALSWEPRYSDLETIIKTAWNWHKTHPNGYNS